MKKQTVIALFAFVGLLNLDTASGQSIARYTLNAAETPPGNSGDEMDGPSLSIYGGAAVTAGNFAKEGGTTFPSWVNAIRNGSSGSAPGFPGSGCARAGFTAGIQIETGGSLGWLVSAAYAKNNVSHNPPWQEPTSGGSTMGVTITSDSWTSLNISTGMKLELMRVPGFRLQVAPLIGAFFAKSPNLQVDISESGTTETVRLSSTSGKALSYGGQVDCTIAGIVLVGARYFYSTPTYDVPYSVVTGLSAVNGTETHKQSTSLILVYLGFSI